MADRMTERDEVTLRLLAIIDDTTIAEQRRRALAVYAEQARRGNPWVAETAEAALRSRRARRNGGANVIRLQVARDG